MKDIKLEFDEIKDNLPKIVSVSGNVSMEEICEKYEQKDRSDVLMEAEGEVAKAEFDKWESYYCFDCNPPRILNRSRQVGSHAKSSKHRNIKPAWKYDQVGVKIFNLKKSYKYGVLVREHLADYYSMKKKNSLKQLKQIVNDSC